MTVKKVLKTAEKVGKAVLGVAVVGAVVESGYHGATMLINDVELVAKTVDSKINPIVMKKPGLFKKPQPFNTRTQKFVNTSKNKKTAKKSK